MRSNHYEETRQTGLNVKSHAGDVFIPPEQLKVYDSTEQMGKVDWIILGLKSTGLSSISSLLPPLIEKNTRILAIMNGMVDEDIVKLVKYASHTGQQAGDDTEIEYGAIYGGMAFICANRIRPGLVHHLHHGRLLAAVASSSSKTSEEGNDNTDDREAIEALWRPTKGFDFVFEESLIRARWNKSLWNLPFTGISVAMGGITVDKIVTDPSLRRLAHAVIDETISIANADLSSKGCGKEMFLGEAQIDYVMSLSDNMGAFQPSMMIDLHSRRPMEVKYMFRKIIDRAQELNISAPHLETLVAQIEAIQRMYGLQ